MSSARRTSRERQVAVWGVLGGLAGLILVAGLLGLIQSRDADGFKNAPTVTVTVTGPCTTTISRRSSGSECPATWTVDGRRTSGTLTTFRGGDRPGPDSDTIEARVYGSTARTALDQGDYRWGLAAPWAVGVGAVVLLVSRSVGRRAQLRLRGEAMALDDVRRLGLTPGAIRDLDEAPEVSEPQITALAADHRLGPVRAVERRRTGVVAPAVVVVVLAGLCYATWGITIGYVLLGFAVLAGAFLASAVISNRRRDDLPTFYADGFFDRTDHRVVATRYDNFQAVWSGRVRRGKNDYVECRARTNEGTELVIGADYRQQTALGERLLRDASAARLPRIRHQLSVGATIPFGPLAATDAGLVMNGTVLGWPQLSDVAIEDDRLVVRYRGNQVACPVASVPWPLTLVMLADERRATA